SEAGQSNGRGGNQPCDRTCVNIVDIAIGSLVIIGIRIRGRRRRVRPREKVLGNDTGGIPAFLERAMVASPGCRITAAWAYLRVDQRRRKVRADGTLHFGEDFGQQE